MSSTQCFPLATWNDPNRHRFTVKSKSDREAFPHWIKFGFRAQSARDFRFFSSRFDMIDPDLLRLQEMAPGQQGRQLQNVRLIHVAEQPERMPIQIDDHLRGVGVAFPDFQSQCCSTRAFGGFRFRVSHKLGRPFVFRQLRSLSAAKPPITSGSIEGIKHAALLHKMHEHRAQRAPFRWNRGQLLRRPLIGNRFFASMQR